MPIERSTTLGVTLLVAALVPLGFLVYTLTHLDELGIPLCHGRVIVELGCALLLAGAGVWVLLSVT